MRSLVFIVLVLSAVLGGCGAEAPSPEAQAAARLEPVIAEAQRRHAALHPPGGGGGGEEAGALLARLVDQREDFAATRRRFAQEAGPCRLICAGQPTRAGAALLKALGEVERHGLKPAEYGMPQLAERVAQHQASLKQAASLPPERAAAGAALWEHLARRTWDGEGLARALGGVEGGLEVADVGLVADALQRAQQDPEAQRAELALEAELAAALLQLVFDLRFANTTGPQPLTSKSAKTEERLQGALVERMRAVVDAPQPGEAIQRLFPGDPHYEALLKHQARYAALAKAGGCPDLPKQWTFPKGTRPGPEVARLKERLRCEGYDPGGEGEEYTEGLEAAVRRYQRHHDLEESGWLGEEDLRSLNVPMQERAEQLLLAAIRLREDREDELGDLYARVNIPAFRLDIIEFGKVIRSQRVIVGTNKLDDNKLKLIQGHINRTPLLRTEITQIVANPDWILPPRVEKGEIVGKMQEDPDYLESRSIKKVTLNNGREVLVQERGDDNVLGQAKFVLKGTNAIYLHDTNDPWHFNSRYRALSHGCMRVQDAVPFAQWLLERDGWEAKEVKDAFSERKRRVQRGMDLKRPIPFVSVYRTAEISEEGLPVFLGDVYRYDKAYAEGEIPPLEQARWGDARLRPPWVPRVPREVVERWRAEGKPAPRDYAGEPVKKEKPKGGKKK